MEIGRVLIMLLFCNYFSFVITFLSKADSWPIKEKSCRSLEKNPLFLPLSLLFFPKLFKQNKTHCSPDVRILPFALPHYGKPAWSCFQGAALLTPLFGPASRCQFCTLALVLISVSEAVLCPCGPWDPGGWQQQLKS